MRLYTSAVSIRHDLDANAAMVSFSAPAPSRTMDYPLYGSTGELEAVVSFTATGQLWGIELLDAARQLPCQQEPGSGEVI